MLDQFRAAQRIRNRQSQIQWPVWLSSDSPCFVNRRGSTSTGVRVSPPAPISHRELEQMSSGLLSRRFRVQVPGGAPIHFAPE